MHRVQQPALARCTTSLWLIDDNGHALVHAAGCRRRDCADCRRRRVRSLMGRLYSSGHDWNGFLTITLDPAALERNGIDPTDRAASMRSLLRGWRTYTQTVRRSFPTFAWARALEPHHGADKRPHLHAIVAGGPNPGGFTYEHVKTLERHSNAWWRSPTGKLRTRELGIYDARADGWAFAHTDRSTIGRTRCYRLHDADDAIRYLAKYLGKGDAAIPGAARLFGTSQNVPRQRAGTALLLQRKGGGELTPTASKELATVSGVEFPLALRRLDALGWRISNLRTAAQVNHPEPAPF